MARTGDADAAVAALFQAQRLPMVRLARLLVDDLETAEDVVQDAFTALHRKWGSIASRDAALGYLRVCVVNGSRSVLRRRRTVPVQPVAGRGPVDAATAPTRGLLLAEEHREVLDALRRLPTRQREVIVLRYWSELPEAEIAAALGISVGAVKSSCIARPGRDRGAARRDVMNDMSWTNASAPRCTPRSTTCRARPAPGARRRRPPRPDSGPSAGPRRCSPPPRSWPWS